jgi:hypothetical protein
MYINVTLYMAYITFIYEKNQLVLVRSMKFCATVAQWKSAPPVRVRLRVQIPPVAPKQKNSIELGEINENIFRRPRHNLGNVVSGQHKIPSSRQSVDRQSARRGKGICKIRNRQHGMVVNVRNSKFTFKVRVRT